MTYQPPVGVWKSSPARKVLWAVKQVLIRVEREAPERPIIRRWERELETRMLDPVLAVDWQLWHAERYAQKHYAPVHRADPKVPDEILRAWEAVPTAVLSLWNEAAEVRTRNLDLPYAISVVEDGLASVFRDLKSIPDAQHDLLRGVMRRALVEEEGQFEFARRIRKEWPAVAKWKAEQIAITEWNRAASVATRVGYERMGIERKVWISAGDNRVCSLCEAAVGDGEIGIRGEFSAGATEPPAHPSCRCNIASA